MKFTLRPYQTESIQSLRDTIRGGSRRPILCLPTGAGKTVTFSELAEQAQRKGSRVGVVCHRTELVSQAKETMEAYGINPLMITYGMVQTYVRSPHKIPEMDLCIIDECHIGNFRKFVDLLPVKTQVIGVTATPLGANKKTPLREVFDSVVAPVQISELIEDGYLSAPVYHVWQLDESKLEKDTKGEFTGESQARVFSMKNLQEAHERRVGKTLIFCSSIKQVKEVAELLGDAFAVHSKMSTMERELIVSQYKDTPNSTMINCGILTAGFDDPTIETVIVYRATVSVSLWLQMCGRGSRVTPTKSRFHIMDLGNNRMRHLAWEVNRDWETIFDLQGRKLKDKAAPMKLCKSCDALIYASAMVCPYCQATQPTRTRQEIEADTITVIDDYSQLPPDLRDSSGLGVEDLLTRAAYGSPRLGRPYNINWVVAQLRGRENFPELVRELARIKGYKEGWIFRQLATQTA